MSYIFVNFLGLILATAGLLFAVLAHNRKNDVFFWLGFGLITLLTLGIVFNVELYVLMITHYSEPIPLMTIGAWVVSIVFLILAKTNKRPNDDNVTDAFLDDIINAEDEVWDPES